MNNPNFELIHIQSDQLNSNPIVVFLHGYSGDEFELPVRLAEAIVDLDYVAFRAPYYFDNYAFAWTGLPDPRTVVTPDQPLAESLLAQAEASGEAIMTELNRLVGVERNIIPVGFSQGAMMTSWLIQRYPERLAGAVLLSGYPFVDAKTPCGNDSKLALNPNFRAFVGYGTGDQVLAQTPLTWLADWVAEQTTAEVHVYPEMVHTITFEEREHIRQYFAKLR
jgi:phospholipase/carboxylesterase